MTNPEAFATASGPLPETGPPSASHSELTAGADSFALELRAESIEQLCGGDALRRGENERIEAGGSEGNADLVAGRDRVQVEDKLTEHTGHGLAVQAAHIDTTVDGSSDTGAGQEDTVLLAGHMRDTWNGGAAVVAAMSDDTAAGGGVRATAPLDLWVHGLMGLEERPGTCTADAVLAEVCGTLYEREYRTAVHAAGLAVFNGTLYQSVRNSFRPLMRISMGVRNLIAAGGGDAGGDVPSGTPPPAPAAGGEQGAGAAAATLSAGRGAEETSQAVGEASGLDVTTVLTRAAGEAGATPDSVTEDGSGLRHGAGTAERLGGLREALRGADAGGEPAIGTRAAEADATAAVQPANGAYGALEILPPEAVAGETPSRLHTLAPGPQRNTGKFELFGGADEPPRSMPVVFDWSTVYDDLNTRYARLRAQGNESDIRSHRNAIEAIDAAVMQNYSFYGGRIDTLAQSTADGTATRDAYSALRRMARVQRDSQTPRGRYVAITGALEAIDQLTRDAATCLMNQIFEFRPPSSMTPPPRPAMPPPRAPLLHARDVTLHNWLRSQRMHASSVIAQGDRTIRLTAGAEFMYFGRIQDMLRHGCDPLEASRRLIDELTSAGQFAEAQHAETLHARLAAAMADPSIMGTPVATGEAGRSPVGPPTGAPMAGTGLPAPSRAPVQPGVTPHPAHVAAPVTPRLSAESTSWRRPTEPAQATSSVQFETGLPRAGEPSEGLPQAWGEVAAAGGIAAETLGVPGPATGTHGVEVMDTSLSGAAGATVPAPHPGTPAGAPRPGLPGPAAPWIDDDFAVERALNAGLLPPGFDASRLIQEWHWLASNTPVEHYLRFGLLPGTGIDAMVEGYRAVEGGRRHALLIGHLQEFRAAVAAALAAAYGPRTNPHWLARVDELLGADLADEAMAWTAHADQSEIQEHLGGVRRSPPPARLESMTAQGRPEVGAGAFPPTGDPWRGGPPGMRRDPIRFGDGRTAGAGDVGLATMQAGEGPGSGRLASGSGDVPVSRREQIARRLVTGEAMLEMEAAIRSSPLVESLVAGGAGSSVRQWRSDLVRDLHRVSDAAVLSPSGAAALEDVDWSALDALVWLLDAPARSE